LRRVLFVAARLDLQHLGFKAHNGSAQSLSDRATAYEAEGMAVACRLMAEDNGRAGAVVGLLVRRIGNPVFGCLWQRPADGFPNHPS
jgi:hypothetical protein